MSAVAPHFGILDNRFLGTSLGVLNPKPPLVVHEEASLNQVLTLLKSHKVGCIVITDLKGKVTGIFSERDVLLKYVGTNLNADSTKISQLMTKDPQTATMTTSVAFALNMMSQGGYRHVPIVDDNHLPVGLVSVKDIVDFISHAITKDLTSFGMATPMPKK